MQFVGELDFVRNFWHPRHVIHFNRCKYGLLLLHEFLEHAFDVARGLRGLRLFLVPSRRAAVISLQVVQHHTPAHVFELRDSA